MARLPRLEWPGEMHHVLLRAPDDTASQGVLADGTDRDAFLQALHLAAQGEPVAVHAYALLPREAQLLVTPGEAGALGRLMQTLGRRFVSAYNARHGRHGSPWAGRFRSAVLQAGPWRLAALLLVDGASTVAGLTSVGQRTGAPREGWLTDPAEFWTLGNTPFEREAAYRQWLAAGPTPAQTLALRQAALGGWALGSAAYVTAAAQAAGRPAQPRPRGRPPKRG